jgi:hypothetical protein
MWTAALGCPSSAARLLFATCQRPRCIVEEALSALPRTKSTGLRKPQEKKGALALLQSPA